jgi:hypothetical protein
MAQAMIGDVFRGVADWNGTYAFQEGSQAFHPFVMQDELEE